MHGLPASFESWRSSRSIRTCDIDPFNNSHNASFSVLDVKFILLNSIQFHKGGSRGGVRGSWLPPPPPSFRFYYDVTYHMSLIWCHPAYLRIWTPPPPPFRISGSLDFLHCFLSFCVYFEWNSSAENKQQQSLFPQLLYTSFKCSRANLVKWH
jgi:hypothetical protein